MALRVVRCRSVIILVINKLDSRFAVVQFRNHSSDYRPNQIPLSPITIINNSNSKSLLFAKAFGMEFTLVPSVPLFLSWEHGRYLDIPLFLGKTATAAITESPSSRFLIYWNAWNVLQCQNVNPEYSERTIHDTWTATKVDCIQSMFFTSQYSGEWSERDAQPRAQWERRNRANGNFPFLGKWRLHFQEKGLQSLHFLFPPCHSPCGQACRSLQSPNHWMWTNEGPGTWRSLLTTLHPALHKWTLASSLLIWKHSVSILPRANISLYPIHSQEWPISNAPAALAEILHHTGWRTMDFPGLVRFSLQFSLPHIYVSL